MLEGYAIIFHAAYSGRVSYAQKQVLCASGNPLIRVTRIASLKEKE